MANLRDKGYGNSMEGLQLPKERHSRQKNVAPGEASVSKGQKVTNSNVQNSSVMRIPSPDEIRASYGESPVNAGSPQRSAPLNLQFTSEKDSDDAYRRGAGAYSAFLDAQKQLVPSETRTDLTPEELKKRIRALEEAMAAMDAAHGKFRVRNFKNNANSEYEVPYYPYSPGEEHPAQPLADFNWDKAEFLDDAGLGLGVSDAQQQLLWMDYEKAAATGRALEEQHEHYIDNHGIPGIENAMAEERQYGNLFHEYNNLKNEYNARLAQYLQGLR